jgi:adenylate cyclase
MDAREASGLVLGWHGREWQLGDSDSVLLGSAEDADVWVDDTHASRAHARIERRRHYFVLVDHSTNGTFVQTEDERISFVRRGELRLWGDGWIALGHPLTAENAIRFHHT